MDSIAIFGTSIAHIHFKAIHSLLQTISNKGITVYIYEPFHAHLNSQNTSFSYSTFKDIETINPQCVFCIGGDGTFLKCAHLFYKQKTPILGINYGKLGFLADVPPENIEKVIQDIQDKNFTILKRSLLSYTIETNNTKKKGIALNEISLQKSNILKLIKINTFIDDSYFCSFWADGVIISTPTGSTGYSLSLGGPIITPNSNSFIIHPIAPHTLSVRPVIIPDTSKIVLQAEGNYTNFLLSNDFKSTLIHSLPKISVEKSTNTVNTIQLNSVTFFDTLRKKLNLGLDVRK